MGLLLYKDGPVLCQGMQSNRVIVVIFFVFMKLLFGIDVAMCDRVHEVEPKHGLCYLLIASRNIL